MPGEIEPLAPPGPSAEDLAPVLATIWDRSTRYLVQDQPLDDEKVARAQHDLGVRLPITFLALLGEQNGGVIGEGHRAHALPGAEDPDDHVPFEDCFGIGEGWGSITHSPLLNAEWELPPALVLLHGDGHWWIALDYRTCGPGGEPPVVFHDDELGIDRQLAPTFGHFLLGLRPPSAFGVTEPDLDVPPGESFVRGGGALSGANSLIDDDLRLLADGRRSLATTKAWCRARAEGPIVRLPASEHDALATALALVDGADDETTLRAACAQVAVALEAAMPAWIAAQLPGCALDAGHLRDRPG